MAEPKSGNIQSIQLLRGVAAFMVLLNHGYDVKALPDSSFKYSFLYGSTGVNIFFIISGFIIPYSMFINNYKLSDFKDFFLKRVTRIEPPYIVSIFLVLLLDYSTTFSHGYTGPAFKIDWLNVLGHIGYFNAFTGSHWLNTAYWTLAVEFEFYILLALLYPLITHRNKWVMTTTYIALAAATFITDSSRHIIHFLPFFLYGIGLFLYKSRKMTLPLYLFLTAVNTLICYMVCGTFFVCLSMIVLLAIVLIKRVRGPFLLLGTISYSLYLTHGVLITRFMGLVLKLHGINVWVAFVISLILCLVFAWFYYITVEKYFLSLSKKIRYRHPRIAAGNKE